MVKDKFNHRLMVGAVEIDITPPIGVPMAGYAARQGSSEGIHDPLKAQAVYLKCVSNELLLITCDLIGFDLNITEKIRDDIFNELGIPQGNVMITCSHTHSGPQGFTPDEPIHMGLEDAGLVEFTRRKLLGAAKWAVSKREFTRLSLGEINLTGIGKNRNNPEDGPQDTQLSVLRFDDDNGNPIAVVFNYACHPTVMGYDNLQISADFPGAARKVLNNQFPSCVFVFTNGASGDISTRFTRRSQSFSEVDRLGTLLAGGVLQAMLNPEVVEVEAVAAKVIDVELPIRSLPQITEINATIEKLQKKLGTLREESIAPGIIRKVVTQLEGAEAQLIMVEELGNISHLSTQMQFLHIGPILLVGVPGEPFSQTVLDIKAACYPQRVVVISYANDNKGYFPDQQSIDQGTYEALISPYDLRVSKLIYQHSVIQCRKE